MNILNCFFWLLLLYVEFNSAADSDVNCHAYGNNLTEALLKDLAEYKAKIEQLEFNIKDLQANAVAHNSCVPFGDDIQTIRVPGTDAFQVACDSKLAGEGWTVIQRRADRAVNFNQQWDGYKNGFGHLRGSFWLGLERLHLMTKLQPHELYIHMEDFRNRTRYARYSNFCIGNEAQSYELLALGEYTGNAGNALDTGNEYSAMNLKFSTPDRDHDKSRTSCALLYKSGWWFYKCYTCNLNGIYRNYATEAEHVQQLEWRTWQNKPLKFVQMMIRPIKSK